MKRQINLLIILATILFSSFSILYRTTPVAHATYVEGVITKDTIWTLVDSPFILSNNVTVNPGVTLTIEPGVQVRFGGEFSLNVDGSIVAEGTEEKKILFTTNDPTQEILWQTISISGNQPSSLINCIIERGTNGTTVEGGLLNVEKTVIRSNLQNGIAVNSGTLTMQNSEIVNNNETAINIGGGNQVNIHNNRIESNGNGIMLTGQLSGTISIIQNQISHNSGNGIALEAEFFVNTAITENTINGNGYGFLVTANTSTYISRNYVSNNTVGFYYAAGNFHRAQFNDIYENGIGMDLDSASTVFVDATRNYWGANTGPEHDSINPYGKGNSVEGNGVSIDFLPFLTHPFTYNNAPPTAVLWTDKTLVAPNQPVTYIGTDSQDDGSIFQYLFDFNDTANSGWTTLTLFNHSYSSTGTYTASLTVEDDFGISSIPTFTTINVANLTPLQASASLSNTSIPYNGETFVSVYASTGAGAAAGASIALFSVKGGSFEPQSGVTDANGYFTAKFTAPNVTETTDVRIIARASMDGYADGSDYKYVRVLSPLKIHITPAKDNVKSEEAIRFDVLVTDYFDQPIAGANLTLSCSNGTLSDVTGITDTYGKAVFNFTAPRTLDFVNATLKIGATKEDFADSEQEAYITVEAKRLNVEVTATPIELVSGETTTITAYVTMDSVPVPNATVTVSSDGNGNFSTTVAETDLAGISRFAFTAPLISSAEGINLTITATAGRDGYVDAQNTLVVPVKPKEMSVNIVPSTYGTYSGAQVNVTIQTTYNRTAVAGVNITVATTNGTFTVTDGTTDQYGNATFTFEAPQVSDHLNITLSVTTTKEGYLETTNQLDILVSPRTFVFQVSPSTVKAGQDEVLTFHVTCKEDGSYADAALVSLFYGDEQIFTNITDVSGTCTFIVNVPSMPDNTWNITLTANRIGFQERTVTMTLNVLPAEGGLSWLTILMIAIPIAIVVIVVVLIKMKLIVVSSKEEETAPE